MKSLLKLTLAMFVVLFFSTCKKECCQDPTNPECENYDPCYGKTITADFFMHQFNGWFVDPKDEKPENCDTIKSNGAKFNAYMSGALSYTWRVGSDTREFTGSSLGILFDDYIKDLNNLNPINKNYYKPIPITLTIRNKIGGCIQAKDSVLSKTRNLVFANKSPWPGTYRGISDHDGQERIIIIYQYIIPNDIYGGRTVFKNLPNILDKDSIIMRGFPNANIKLNSFKNFWWDIERDEVIIDGGSSEIPKPRPYDGMNMGKIHINPQPDGRDHFSFEYKYCTEDGRVKFYKFTGRREP
jgi:hypothetical protein